MSYQIVILAAGKGKRMGKGDLPKVLVPLNQRAMLVRLLGEMKNLFPVDKHVVVVGYKSDLVRQALGQDYYFALQKEQLGTANAVLAAKPYINAKNVLVLYGDMPFIKAASVQKLIDNHIEKQSLFSMFTTKPPHFENEYATLNNFGRILRDQNNKIVKIKEFLDATEKERQITEVNPGIYLFNSDWLFNNLGLIKNHNQKGEYYLTDIVEVAIKQDITVSTLDIDPKEVFGINTPEQLAQAEKLILYFF